MGPPPAVAAVRRAVRGSLAGLPRESRVVVACSGGADSLALAAATAYEAPRSGLRAGAVTIDHGLQPGSGAHAARVADQLVGLGLDPVDTVAVRIPADSGDGLEAAARRVRYAALEEALRRQQAVAVLLGHSRDDQAETVLLGLARGSGARSLAGMAAVTGPYRRPFLDLPRDVIRQACTALDLHPWEDPHNTDRSFARVRVRTAALPVLEQTIGPGIAAALARSAQLLRADADALDAWAAAAATRCTGAEPGSLQVGELSALPAAVRGRVLRAAALEAGCPPGELTADHVHQVEALVTGWHGQGPLHLPGGVRAARASGLVRFGAVTP